MIQLRLIKTIVIIMLAFVPTLSQAATIDLFASLDGDQANAGAGTGSLGVGTAYMSFDDQSMLFEWDLTYSGLSGPATAAHFHGPAAPGQNAGVALGIGTANPAVGSATLDTSQASDLLAGLWYINIHTNQFAAGEIRGQVQVVPLPAALWLLLSGLLVLTGLQSKTAGQQGRIK